MIRDGYSCLGGIVPTHLAKVVTGVEVGNFLRLAQRVGLNHAGSPLPRARDRGDWY